MFKTKMTMVLSKDEIIKHLTAEIAYRYENEDHNNGSKKVKALRVIRGLVSDYLTDGLSYELQCSVAEFGYHINNGHLYEIAMNHKDGNKITKIHACRENDNLKKVYTEYKSLHDIGTLCKMSVADIEKATGIIVGLPEGDYYISGKKLREHLDELPDWYHDKDKRYPFKRFYANTVRELGTRRTDNTKYW